MRLKEEKAKPEEQGEAYKDPEELWAWWGNWILMGFLL